MVLSGTPSTMLDRTRLRRAGWSVALVAAAMCTPVIAHGQWLPWKKRAPKAQPAATRPSDSLQVKRTADTTQAPGVPGDTAGGPAAGNSTRGASSADTVGLPGIGVMVRPAQPAETAPSAAPIYIPRMPNPAADSAAARQEAATPPEPTEPSVTAAPQPDAAAAAADTVPVAGTHVVKKGDTLWDLAHAYLGDPFQWPEIYRLNTDVVEDPHWIYPGERLRLPGGADTTRRDVARGDEPPSMLQATVFNRMDDDGAPRASRRAATPSVVGSEPSHAVRAGEIYAAPWVDRRGGADARGRMIVAVSPSAIKAATERPRLQLYDRVYAALPGGSSARPGDRFLVVTDGPELSADAQIMIPTGIVRVERPGASEASTVQIIAQFGEIRRGQALIPIQRFPIPADVRPAPRELGVRSRVLWIPSGAVLPSLLHYVVLDAKHRDGVTIGDQFTLVRSRTRTEDGDVLPEEPVAVVQVVRVTERGTTAVVVGQRHPAIRPGMEARLTAKMP